MDALRALKISQSVSVDSREIQRLDKLFVRQMNKIDLSIKKSAKEGMQYVNEELFIFLVTQWDYIKPKLEHSLSKRGFLFRYSSCSPIPRFIQIRWDSELTVEKYNAEYTICRTILHSIRRIRNTN